VALLSLAIVLALCSALALLFSVTVGAAARFTPRLRGVGGRATLLPFGFRYANRTILDPGAHVAALAGAQAPIEVADLLP
jgi:hypothetical protein